MLLFYYSFFRGDLSRNRTDWILDDIKLPALDPKSAVILDFYLHTYQSERNSPWSSRTGKGLYIAPGKMTVMQLYRGLIEYEKIYRKSYGRTLVQYKKINQYSQWYLQELFHDVPWNSIKMPGRLY